MILLAASYCHLKFWAPRDPSCLASQRGKEVSHSTQALDSRSQALQREDRKDHARPGVIAALAGRKHSGFLPGKVAQGRSGRFQGQDRSGGEGQGHLHAKGFASIDCPWMFQETPVAAAALRHPLQAVELVPGLKSVLSVFGGTKRSSAHPSTSASSCSGEGGDRDIRLRPKKRSDPRSCRKGVRRSSRLGT